MTAPTSGNAPGYQPQLALWVRQLLTVLMLLACLYLITLTAPVLPMLTIAFLIAFVMAVPSRSLARRTPIPYAIAVILLYTLLIIVFVLGMIVVVPILIGGINNLIGSLQQGYSDLIVSLTNLKPEDAIITIFGVQVNLTEVITTTQGLLLNGTAPRTTGFLLPTQIQSNAPAIQTVSLEGLLNQVLPLFGSVSQTVTSAISSITGFIGSFLLALFVSFLVLLDVPVTRKMLARNIPTNYHREFALVVDKVVHVWNGFFRGQVLIGFGIGLLTYIQLNGMGIPNAFILSVLTALISLIPTIGGIIALVPLALIPLIQGSTSFPQVPHTIVALLVVVINLVISQIMWNLIAPKILGDALQLPLPVIIVGVFIGAAAAGVLGAFLAAPITATLKVILGYVWHKVNLEDPYPGEAAPFRWYDDPYAYQGKLRLKIRVPAQVNEAVRKRVPVQRFTDTYRRFSGKQ